MKFELDFEKDAPKSKAFGTRTPEGILIKVWVPKGIKAPESITGTLDLSIKKSKEAKPSKSKKRKQEEEDDENDFDEDDDDEEDDEEG